VLWRLATAAVFSLNSTAPSGVVAFFATGYTPVRLGDYHVIGQIAPDFQHDCVDGKLRLHHYLGNDWGVLFSHPRNFAPVCTTEVAGLEWDKRHIKPLGLSVDPGVNHTGWGRDIEETRGRALNFPVIADVDRSVSNLYGVIQREAVPSLPDADAKERFPGGWKTLKPYLRVVEQPKLPHETA
jgi:peroxiredoxin